MFTLLELSSNLLIFFNGLLQLSPQIFPIHAKGFNFSEPLLLRRPQLFHILPQPFGLKPVSSDLVFAASSSSFIDARASSFCFIPSWYDVAGTDSASHFAKPAREVASPETK